MKAAERRTELKARLRRVPNIYDLTGGRMNLSLFTKTELLALSDRVEWRSKLYDLYHVHRSEYEAFEARRDR